LELGSQALPLCVHAFVGTSSVQLSSELLSVIGSVCVCTEYVGLVAAKDARSACSTYLAPMSIRNTFCFETAQTCEQLFSLFYNFRAFQAYKTPSKQ